MSEATILLGAVERGDPKAADQLLETRLPGFASFGQSQDGPGTAGPDAPTDRPGA